MSEEQEITDGQKWKIQALFQEFFKKTPLAKGHLEVIEQNWRTELNGLIEDLRQAIDDSGDEITRSYEERINDLKDSVKKQLDDLEDKIESDIRPFKLAFKIGKWVMGLLLTVIAGGILNQWIF